MTATKRSDLSVSNRRLRDGPGSDQDTAGLDLHGGQQQSLMCTHDRELESWLRVCPPNEWAVTVPLSDHNDDIRNHKCLHSIAAMTLFKV